MVFQVFLCTFASLSTALGGLIVILFKKISNQLMASAQGFAAGVMIAVSFVDMLPHCYSNSLQYMKKEYIIIGMLLLFIVGWVIGVLLETLVVPVDTKESDALYNAKKLMFITTAVVVMHNLPEGVLTMFSGVNDTKFGITMALAIALHNLPEGMAIAAPVMYVTKSRKKAFLQSMFAGLAELFGGVFALMLLSNFIQPRVLDGLFAIIAGIMVQASVCQLIPAGLKFAQRKYVVYGILTGIGIMLIGMLII